MTLRTKTVVPGDRRPREVRRVSAAMLAIPVVDVREAALFATRPGLGG